MGWKEGKGLGSKEDGATQHIKIPVKKDNRGSYKKPCYIQCVLRTNVFLCCQGVGSKKGRDDDWIGHQDAFDKILAGLNTVQNGETKVSSQEGTPIEDSLEAAPGVTLMDNAAESKKLV